jgi:iron complex outermembrane receptor protein
MLVALSDKNWGKWFYASPAAIDQYEETTASLVGGFQRLLKKVILLGSQRYIGDVMKTNIFILKESVYLQEFAYFKQNCCRIKRIVYIKYWCYWLWYRNGKVFLSSNNLGIITVSKYFVLECMEF